MSFEAGQVWAIAFEDEEPWTVYYLIERLPPQDNGPRFGVSHNTWRVFVLDGDPAIERNVGAVVCRQLDGVGFHEQFAPDGYDSYDNRYTRIA